MSELCTKCRLWKTSQTSNGVYSCNKLMGVGGESPKVMFVGDWPGVEEIQQKVPFVSSPGQLLKKALNTIGMNPNDCYFTYIAKCKPPFDKLPTKTEMATCSEYLHEEIERIKPKVVVALGATVAGMFGMKGGITAIRGTMNKYKYESAINGDTIEVDVLAINHPAYINNFVEKSTQRNEFLQDLTKAMRLASGEDLLKKQAIDYRVAKTIEDVREIVDHLLKAEWISYDSETTSLSCFEGKIIVVSFSDANGKGYVIPYEYPGIFNEEEQAIVKYELGRILGSNVKKVMQNGKFDIQFLFKYNIPIKMFAFDTMLAHNLLDENSKHGLASTVPIYTDMGSYKDEVHDYIVGNIPIKIGVNEKGKDITRPSTILDCPYDTLTHYAAQDADATYRLFKKFMPLLQAEGLLKLLIQVVVPVSYVLAKMEYRGVLGDLDYVNTAVAGFKSDLIRIDRDIQTSAPIRKYLTKYNKTSKLSERKFKNRKYDYSAIVTKLKSMRKINEEGFVHPTFMGIDEIFKIGLPKYTEEQWEDINDMLCESAGRFNINSPKQKSELLFEVLDLSPLKKNRVTEKQRAKGQTQGSFSVDAEALQKLYDEHSIKVIKDILEYSKFKKFNEYVESYQTLLNASPDGRIHTNYNQAITVTGRLSSSAPNLQNIPKRDKQKAKIVRRTFIASPGYTLVEADFSQIEFRLWGHCSGDPRLLEMLANGQDIHYQIAANLLNTTIDKVNKDQRDSVKKIVYGMMYGQSAYSLAKDLGETEERVSAFIQGFFDMFPKAEKWMNSNVTSMEQNGYVVNFMGRRRRALDIYSRKQELKESAQRQSKNSPLQSGSADLIYQAMVKIYKDLLPYDAYPILQIHDSLVFEVKDEILPQIIPIIKDVMENTVKLLCETSVGMELGKNLAEMTKIEIIDDKILIFDKKDEKGKAIGRVLYIMNQKENA